MKTLYLDQEFRIHMKPFDGARIVHTDIFDRVENFDTIAQYHRYIPNDVESWRSKTGEVYHACEFVPFDAASIPIINNIQTQYYAMDMSHTQDIADLVEMIYEDDLEVIG